ncbi:MAG: LytR C-terminal domain-containing protein [Candidatus Dojkabacteria bacterium]|nr:LytR C-terminal domain-containing protein [Candidatus Dojkabacteria bacterium]
MRRRIRKKKESRVIPYRAILIGIVLSLFLGYVIYFLISFLTIRSIDRSGENLSSKYLLTEDSKDSKKTLVMVESGYDNDRKISDTFLLITNTSKGKSLLIYIPGWLYYKGLEENFGNAIPISSFRYAGDTLQEGRGIEYAVWQIGQVLGLKFNNYIYLSSEATDTLEDVYGFEKYPPDRYIDMYNEKFSDSFYNLNSISSGVSILKSIFNPQKIRGLDLNIYSNLNFVNVFGFLIGINNTLKSTDAYGIDMSSYIYSEEKFVDTGGQRRYVDTKKFDEYYRSFTSSLLDKELEKERVRIEVYNGSGVAGAAMELGRKLENAGCDVVRYENAPDVQDKTLLYISNKEDFPKSLSVVSSILSDYYVLLEGRPSFMTTGDIVIIIGEDLKLMYGF